ncbi:hypothetical protein O0I10_004887 [Lichtheimia ornata]|uniref:Heterokaryon incompatibility domain-containing protein n=1 Tax=Lichtheimia ornata TaxID=688661 RepID=A0AAD7V7V7_9FUNG|nr:uncharacterized protein O0I10_004887 [Lichtheimia ornata]KAJ8659522.1 hypothetical protein O0I10_004887 [Lichtheimia ornata]
MTITSTSTVPPPDTEECGKLWTLEDTFIHPEFRLLYVPPKDENDKMMTIITPSKHEPSYVPDRKFYALSHLWGTDPKDNLWDVSDFISDEDGTTVDPIPMREEKRETFLNLLQENPGYWWIDVLCCRSDTPPIIMRGVYGCCHTCFAMLDCPSEAIEFFSTVILDPSKTYGEPIEGTSFERNMVKGAALWKHARDIGECRWFSRVWTMQELALPSSVILLAETCHMPCYYVSADSVWVFQYSNEFNLRDKDNSDFQANIGTLRRAVGIIHGSEEHTANDFYLLDSVLLHLAKSERSCYFAEDYVYGVLGILGLDIPRLNDIEDIWDRFLFSFQRFVEKRFWESVKDLFCCGPFFYSPNKTYNEPYPETATKHCQETMHFNICEGARSCALSGASKMADVYRGLLEITVNCSCSRCRFITTEWLNHFRYFTVVIRD